MQQDQLPLERHLIASCKPVFGAFLKGISQDLSTTIARQMTESCIGIPPIGTQTGH
jgi:hypothetical protein